VTLLKHKVGPSYHSLALLTALHELPFPCRERQELLRKVCRASRILVPSPLPPQLRLHWVSVFPHSPGPSPATAACLPPKNPNASGCDQTSGTFPSTESHGVLREAPSQGPHQFPLLPPLLFYLGLSFPISMCLFLSLEGE
jgi:hypothetical protein